MKIKILYFILSLLISKLIFSADDINSLNTEELLKFVQLKKEDRIIDEAELKIITQVDGNHNILMILHRKRQVGIVVFRLIKKTKNIFINGLQNLSIEKDKTSYISGVGTSLLSVVKKICLLLEYNSISLEPEPSRFIIDKKSLIKFYQKNGFEFDKGSTDYMTWSLKRP